MLDLDDLKTQGKVVLHHDQKSKTLAYAFGSHLVTKWPVLVVTYCDCLG